MKDSDGYFSIRLADDYDKYITVPSGSETSVGSEFTFESANASSRQKWRITKLSNGAFTISAKSSESYPNGDLVISLPSSGTKLQQCEYTNNTDYKDEWVFVPYSIMFYEMQTTSNHDHHTMTDYANNCFLRNYGIGMTIKNYTVPSSTCRDDLLNANIFTIYGHGKAYFNKNTNDLSATVIVTEGAEDNDNLGQKYRLSSHAFSESDEKTTNLGYSSIYDYSNLDLVVFVGCQTAYDGEHANNLPSRIVALGARSAVGFRNNIDCEEATQWVKRFYDLLFESDSVETAAKKACDGLGSITENDVVVCGDKDFEIPHK